MDTHSKILAVIPARGGSRGVPRKNIRPLAGKPLIAHTIEAALEVRELFHRVIVSTDDEEISGIARDYGAEVPFLRPRKLAGDKTPMLHALQHAVEEVERSDAVRFDWIMLLQPTVPFRRAADLRATVQDAEKSRPSSVISVVRVLAHHPILMKKIENGRLLSYCLDESEGTRRQDYDPPAYMRNGSIYLTRRDVLIEQNSIWGDDILAYEMSEKFSVNIDSEIDFLAADALAMDEMNTSQMDTPPVRRS